MKKHMEINEDGGKTDWNRGSTVYELGEPVKIDTDNNGGPLKTKYVVAAHPLAFGSEISVFPVDSEGRQLTESFVKLGSGITEDQALRDFKSNYLWGIDPEINVPLTRKEAMEVIDGKLSEKVRERVEEEFLEC